MIKGVFKILTRGHRIELDINKDQESYFKKACGCARKAYNWALDLCNTEYDNFLKAKDALIQAGKTAEAKKLKPKRISGEDLHKQINVLKKTIFNYMYKVTKCAPQQGLKNLTVAFNRFFTGVSKHPRFKKKGKHDSFYISNDQFHLNEDMDKIWIPNLGYVKMKEKLRFDGKILNAVVNRTANKWFVSICVEVEDPIKIHQHENISKTTSMEQLSGLHNLDDNQAKLATCLNYSIEAVGYDMGINKLLHSSNNVSTLNPRWLKKSLKKLKKLQKALSRKKGSRKGEEKSKNFKKAQIKVAKQYATITNQRNDNLHKTTTEITRNNPTVCFEDLYTAGMIRNKKLSRAISDCGFGEMKRQLEYKAEATGTIIVEVSRWFPSSQICSACGNIKSDLKLKDRLYVCPSCGLSIDRDYNASLNLKHYAETELPKFIKLYSDLLFKFISMLSFVGYFNRDVKSPACWEIPTVSSTVSVCNAPDENLGRNVRPANKARKTSRGNSKEAEIRGSGSHCTDLHSV